MTAPDFFARPSWHQHAACRGLDPALFFVGRGGPSEPAKEVCASCPVRAECLDAGLDPQELWGVWGGKSGLERNWIRKQRRQERITERRVS